MTKQSIKDFFEPNEKLFALSFTSILAVWFIFASSGITILDNIISKVFLLPISFSHYLHGGLDVFLLIIWFFSVSYIFSCLLATQYGKLKKNRQILTVPKSKFQVVKNLLTMIILLFLFSVLILFNSDGGSKAKAKASRTIGALAQARTIMAYEFTNHDNYDSFSCSLQDMETLCSDIARQLKESSKGPTIILNKKSNSSSACIYSPIYIQNGKDTQKSGWFYYLMEKFQEKKKVWIWYCADSTGIAGQTSIDPGSAGYCVDGVSAKCPPANN